MKIEKVYNNNVVSAYNEENTELVIMGKGLAFQKKPGDEIEEEKIEKVFTLKNNDISERFKSLLYEVSLELMEVAEEIIKLAKSKLGRELNDSIYISLTDHINFAIERNKKGLDIKNALLWEIKKLYKDEFSIGLEALYMIKEKLEVTLPEDEAGFIAMHIVNAELNEEMPNIVNITKTMQDILKIVKYHFGLEFNEESLNFFRFVTHLKFFAQRLYSQTYMESDDDFLFEAVKNKHKDAFECTEKINDYVKRQFNYELTNDEKLYLTVHIERVVNR
ncbi:BglG family transcription antiterminator LicT [Metabacillus halosaccharovorans]|uniref:BglG family transcription antiterminator LicT n=1 Tax=Metabacillus halosaccharovorans TaxID=930124 RepID=UPI001C1F98F1|nr:PRD domain-containing protein [Metabacillus halosaccharovorans]MBU7595341.1 PRD domain-containing protein [Metabacillus halosaccharovorans]MCM3439928.1 PRD domain-containing protein [Metabacillus halosaccharovorans]